MNVCNDLFSQSNGTLQTRTELYFLVFHMTLEYFHQLIDQLPLDRNDTQTLTNASICAIFTVN